MHKAGPEETREREWDALPANRHKYCSINPGYGHDVGEKVALHSAMPDNGLV